MRAAMLYGLETVVSSKTTGNRTERLKFRGFPWEGEDKEDEIIRGTAQVETLGDKVVELTEMVWMCPKLVHSRHTETCGKETLKKKLIFLNRSAVKAAKILTFLTLRDTFVEPRWNDITVLMPGSFVN